LDGWLVRRLSRCGFSHTMELPTDARRLFVSAISNDNNSHRRGCCRRPLCSKVFSRVAPVTRAFRNSPAWPDFHDVEGRIVRTSESILRIVDPDTALFFRGAWLGDTHPRT